MSPQKELTDSGLKPGNTVQYF